MARERSRRSELAASVVFLALTVSSAGLGLRAAGAAPAQAPEPPLLPTPAAECGPRSRPESGIQGRVPVEDHESGRAAQGHTSADAGCRWASS